MGAGVLEAPEAPEMDADELDDILNEGDFQQDAGTPFGALSRIERIKLREILHQNITAKAYGEAKDREVQKLTAMLGSFRVVTLSQLASLWDIPEHDLRAAWLNKGPESLLIKHNENGKEVVSAELFHTSRVEQWALDNTTGN